MTNGVSYAPGQVITLWWGVVIVDVIVSEGNTYELPEEYEGFDHAMVVAENQSYTQQYIDRNGRTGTMNNGVTFYNGQRISIVVR